MTDGTGEQGRGARGTGRRTLALARVVGYLIVPLYVVG